MGCTQSSTAAVDSKATKPPKATLNHQANDADQNYANHVQPVGFNGNDQVVPGATTPKMLSHSSSAIGLESMIETRKEEGDLVSNIVRLESALGQPIQEIYEGVMDGPILGKGVMGIVRLITHRVTRLKYAVKCLDLSQIGTAKELQQLREEISIMCQLDHPNIVRLEEVYESNDEIYLVMELCVGGDLFDRLDEQPDYRYTEGECARMVKQICSSVRYLHSKGIIHRDLKLENFLFSTTEKDAELKMCDFGLSKHFQVGEKQSEVVGTPYSVAPEVILGNYDEKCDVWAIGVVTFLLLSGEPPFGGCGDATPYNMLRQNIMRGAYKFAPAEVWDKVSPEARAFIRTLLVVNPIRRPTVQEVQNHPWLKTWAERTRNGNDTELNPNVVRALVNFKGLSDIRRLLSEVLSFTLLPEQIKELRSEFEKMDTDGSGEISLEALESVLVSSAGSGSLGALAKDEIHEIFQAMSVSKGSRIHWHEFLAATLSQSQVDDRNLRLAFDRLDSDHKGYIAIEDIMDLLGTAAPDYEETVRKDWGDDCLMNRRITYDDFMLIMKGQTNETIEPLSAMLSHSDGLELKLGADMAESKSDVLGTSGAVAGDFRPHYRRFRSLSDKGQGEIFNESEGDLGSKGNLYLTHLQLRLAIVEACNRFESLQKHRASIALQVQQAAGTKPVKAAHANLVMRNEHQKQDSSEALMKAMTQTETERQDSVEEAFKRGGRGRRARMKTVSDMYGMLTTTRDAMSSTLLNGQSSVPMGLSERLENQVSFRKPFGNADISTVHESEAEVTELAEEKES